MAGRSRKNVKKKPFNPRKPLENKRHEDCVKSYFANNYVKAKAIREVYGEGAGRNGMGNRVVSVFNRDDVKARIKYLYEKRKGKTLKAEKEDLVNMLLKRASVSLSDVVSIDYDEDGKPVAAIVPSDLFDGQVVDEVNIIPTAFGDRIKVKLPDKEKNIELVAKLEKMLTDDTTINNVVNVQNDAADEAYRKRMERERKKVSSDTTADG